MDKRIAKLEESFYVKFHDHRKGTLPNCWGQIANFGKKPQGHLIIIKNDQITPPPHFKKS